MTRWLAGKMSVHEGEGLAVAVLFTHYFLVSAAVIAGKSARDAFFLSRYDKSLLPLMYLASAVLVTLAMAAFSRVTRRLPAGAAAASTLAFFAVTLILIELNIEGWMIAVLYVWMEVIGAVVILQSWMLTGNAFDPRQAKRLFGVIAAGGSIAAWAGGSAVAWMTARFGSTSLLTTVAVALTISIVTAWYGSRFQAPRPRSRTAPVGKRRRLHLSPYVLSIAVVIASASIVSAVVQYRFQSSAAAMYPTRDQLVTFFGQFYAWTGLASLASQLVLSRLLLARFGVIGGLFVLPAFLTTGLMMTLISPSLLGAAFGRFSDLTFKFTVNNTSLEMLWLPVPPEERQRVKPVISGTMKAVAEALTAILMFALVKLTPAWVLSGFAMMVCGVWLSTVVRLRGQYRKALASVIEKRQLDPEALRISAADPAMVELLTTALRSKDEAEQMAALGFLEGYPPDPWRSVLRELYESGSAAISDRVLALAGDDATIITDEAILDKVRAGGSHAVKAVGIAASRGLSAVRPVLAENMQSGNPGASVPAAIAVLRYGMGDADRARQHLSEWLDSQEPGAITAILRALPPESGLVPAPRLRAFLAAESPMVRRAALAAVADGNGTIGPADVVPCLGDARCALQARIALRAMAPEQVVEALGSAAGDPGSDRRLRCAALRALNEYAERLPEDRVALSVSAHDLTTYCELAELLRRVRCLRPLMPVVADRVWTDRAAIHSIAWRAEWVRHTLANDGDAILVRDHASHQYRSAVLAITRLTVLEHPEFPVDACVRAALAGDRTLLPYVHELIESTLSAEGKRLLAPLIDDSQVSEREAILGELHLSLDTVLGDAANSDDPWEVAIVNDYIGRKGRLARAATVNGGIVPDEGNLMYSTLEKTIILKSSELFADIPAENLTTLAAVAAETRLPVDSVVFRDGQPGDSLYVIASGAVRIVKGDTQIALLAKGSCFGEMAVLDQAPRSADAVVADEAVLLRLSSEDFYEALAENPSLTQGIVRLLARRLRDANARIAGSA